MNASDYNWCPSCNKEPEPDCKFCEAIRESLRQASLMAIADMRHIEQRRIDLAQREYEIYYKGLYDEW